MRAGIEFGFVGIGRRLVAVEAASVAVSMAQAPRDHRLDDIARVLRAGGECQAERGQREDTLLGSHLCH